MDTKKTKIRRFTSGKFSFNDYLEISSLFKKQSDDEGFVQYLEEDWNGTKNEKSDLNKEKVLAKLHHQINLNLRIQRATGKVFRALSKLAVILILPALISIGVLSYIVLQDGQSVSWAEVHSPIGARTKFLLPDGSEGWLNGGSSIKYPVVFGKYRKVEVSGEAYFDVVHLAGAEFVVSTPYFDVTVLGTRFNVVAYDNEQTAEVILEKGKVLVTGEGSSYKSILIPDQCLKYDKVSRKVLKTTIDSKLYNSWKDGKLIFKNSPITEIEKRLERRYNVDIVLYGDSLENNLYRATFQDESIDEIMSFLSTITPSIEYKIHARERLADGELGKTKIEVWIK